MVLFNSPRRVMDGAHSSNDWRCANRLRVERPDTAPRAAADL
ncbi:hypothetical protein [Nocardia blacklockiae]|nr:hypothetical protein [Nocardia blacklockiae]